MLEILRKYVKDESLIKHCIAVAGIMREVAKELKEDAELWWKVGLLHDIDYELCKGDMSKHGVIGGEILVKEGFSDIAEFVRGHNHMLFGNYEKPIEIALQASDSISGLIIACALVKGGRITDVTVKTIKKKFKEKSFAAGCDRERIRLIEKIMPLENFYEIALRGAINVKEDLGFV
ncbi:MAG: HDIG domain-containing protein [Archaeoglobaceae archaeon]|nr:HDIG domain-containing protein [Archaeoglobaceae archaeon]MDW8128758.1 HDIG domain-containing protein [Archaeoglobaceae archaeon]